MKYSLIAVAFCLLFASFSFAQSDEINVIPKPRLIVRGDGYFELSRKTGLVAKNAEDRVLADWLNEYLQTNFGLKLMILPKPSGKANVIILSGVFSDASLPVGGYDLSIARDRIGIIASDQAGRFYALQSLIQLMPVAAKGKVQIPAVSIKDSPRFSYRGMHLDVSRHFFPVEFVKKYIDLMSQYKFNTFHWHLTDDQGWRVEIKKYPRLTEIGSKRSESLVGRFSTEFKGDGVPVEGFYTQDQIRDVVAYAKARYITVIPEIELPGHSSAALAAYPELGCKADYKYEVKKTWGIFKEVYCPTEKTFAFLEDVLTEVIGLFPDSPYIHVGGDEVLKDMWKESPKVKALMEKENLKDEHEVQSYFIRRMEKFINSKGKKIIGWDEILEGGLAPNATVMSWRGIKGGIAAAKEHHDVIMTPTDYCYFDFGQGDPATEPLNIGGYIPIEKVYGYDPIPKELTADEAKYILGVQANIWTEYLPTPASVEYSGFPRVLALAEVAWSTPDNKNFADFTKRLASQFARLDIQNVNYRIPEPAGLTNRVLAEGEKAELDLTPPVTGSRVFYTTDGSTPDEKSTLYTDPISVEVTEKGRVDVKCVVVLATGRKSSVYTATLLRTLWHGPEPELKEKRLGATFAFVVPATGDSLDPTITSGETKTTGLQQFAKTADLKQSFGVTFDGYLNVPVDAIYEFQAETTWDTTILLDGERLIDDAGTKDRKIRSNVIALRAGLHKISLRYNHRGGDAFWRIRWAIKGQNWRNLSGGELVH
ncbi:hypothetical protein BH10ACI3_BH10ACI3_17280 [soil metagenome]